jgi:hypothetical protein
MILLELFAIVSVFCVVIAFASALFSSKSHWK